MLFFDFYPKIVGKNSAIKVVELLPGNPFENANNTVDILRGSCQWWEALGSLKQFLA